MCCFRNTVSRLVLKNILIYLNLSLCINTQSRIMTESFLELPKAGTCEALIYFTVTMTLKQISFQNWSSQPLNLLSFHLFCSCPSQVSQVKSLLNALILDCVLIRPQDQLAPNQSTIYLKVKIP